MPPVKKMGRNFHVLICHGPLQIATFWRVAPSTFTTVYVSEIWKGPTSVDITLSPQESETLKFCRILYKVSAY